MRRNGKFHKSRPDDSRKEPSVNLWRRFIERVPLTRSIHEGNRLASKTLNRSRDPSALSLFEAIVQRSLACVGALDEDLKASTPKSRTDYLQRRLQVFYECVCFLRHVTAFFVFAAVGEHKMKTIVDDLLPPLLVEFTVSHFYKSDSSDSVPKSLNEFKQRFYDYLNSSDREYASCTEFILRPEEDFVCRVTSGDKTKGKLNLLADKIGGILSDHRPATYVHLMQLLISATDIKGLEPIATNAAKAI
jgi:hypothetical protein